MSTLYEAKGLQKHYQTGDVVAHALRGIDLRIRPGEFVAIMGSSGSGKSTLLHLLGGLDRPDAGELYLLGQRVDGLSERAWAKLRRANVGYVFQFFNLINNMTVAHNIDMPALLLNTKQGDVAARRHQLLDELGIAEHADKYPAQLSGGQQQRVAIARALINQPPVLLADEPTGNLDSQSTNEVLRLLQRSHAKGQTIVLVTHDVRVGAMADRVIYMRDGSIVDSADMVPGGQAHSYLDTMAVSMSMTR